jgi:hypothetical protein
LGSGTYMKKCSYCGRESDDALTTCQECGTTLPQQSITKPPPIATVSDLQARRKALLDGMIRALFSLGILAMGWFYPGWFFERDPIMHHETDRRLGSAELLSLLASFIFAVLAVRSLRRACISEPPSRSQ